MKYLYVLEPMLSYKYPKAVAWRCSIKKVFLEISQNSQEHTCARVSFLIKLQALKRCTLHRSLSLSEMCDCSRPFH